MADTDDPFKQPEATSLRPRPGAGRRAWNESARPASPATSFSEAPAIPRSIRAALGIGLNPLVRAASPALLLAGRLRGVVSAPNVPGLRRHALDEIRLFEEHARTSGVQERLVGAARYLLCAALDEAVLSTPWGADSEWSEHSLLVELHQQAWGGEKFFETLDRIEADPAQYIDLMELQYLCLAFGFAGKYEALDRGREHLAEVQRNLFRKIRDYRGNPEQELSVRWRGVEDRRNKLIRYVPWWVVGAAMLAVLAIAYTAFRTVLGSVSAPVQSELANLESSSPVVESARASGPTLKKVLEADEQLAGKVSIVEEPNGRTVVTPLARNLFASGSASVNPDWQETLVRIAKALNEVPGRVLVVGHTDSQPIRSLQYQDNVELSRERALSVVKILESEIATRGRLSWKGAGPYQPLYPESDPANRERNRRVEIIHESGT